MLFDKSDSLAKTYWNATKSKLAKVLDSDLYETWINRLIPVNLNDNLLSLSGPNQFFLSWIQMNLLENIESTLKEVAENEGLAKLSVDFCLNETKSKANKEVEISFKAEDTTAKPKRKTNNVIKQTKSYNLELPKFNHYFNQPLRFNPKYTFDNFIVGDNSLYAFSAAKALANDQPLGSESLFFVADHGLGKSHLSQALSQEILRHKKQKQVFYVTAEDFTNELVFSIKNNSMELFKNKYRNNCDVLILEDMHFLAGKEKVQAELEFTLDCLMESGSKIIFTAPQAPNDIPRLGRSLKSRLSSSLLSVIGPPEYKTRLKILGKKAAELKLFVPNNVLEFLAERLMGDVRCLESSLVSLNAKSKLLNKTIDLSLARDSITNLTMEEVGINPQTIRGIICHYFKLNPDELISQSRRKKLVDARGIGMYLSRRLTNQTLEEIGKTFGRKHSTALYAINKTALQIKKDLKLKNQCEFLRQQIFEKS